jgi:hypothetical protein
MFARKTSKVEEHLQKQLELRSNRDKLVEITVHVCHVIKRDIASKRKIPATFLAVEDSYDFLAGHFAV